MIRRSDHDVTNAVRTTDPEAVGRAVRGTLSGVHAQPHWNAFDAALAYIAHLYRGEVPGYRACDTPYHNLQHCLDVTLAMARLLAGHERSQAPEARLGSELVELGVICALFHDAGYIRRTADHRARSGAHYTRNHVTRGGAMLRAFLPQVGMAAHARPAACLLHYSGYERPIARIRLADLRYRLLGFLLGSADLTAQMADRCYLEKCHRHLYAEFVEGGVAVARDKSGREQVVFSSADDLLFKTPAFYAAAQQRLDQELHGAQHYAARHFGGDNPYLEAIEKNIAFARQLASSREVRLRRQTP
jgi:hypothetical protein